MKHPARRPRIAGTVLTAVIATLAAPLPPGAAALHAQGIADVDRLVRTAATLQHVLGERDYATALILGLAARDAAAGAAPGAAAALTPGADAPAALPAGELAALVQAAALRAGELDACRRITEVVDGTLCALERLHAFAPPALVRPLADEASVLVAQALRGAPAQAFDQLVSPLTFHRTDALQRYLEQRLETLWPAGAAHAPADADAGAAAVSSFDVASQALEPWLRARLGFSAGDGAASVLAANPTLAALLAAYPVLGDVRTRAFAPPSAELVVGAYQSFFGTLVDSAHVAVLRLGAVGGAADVAAALAGGALPAGDIGEWSARRAFVFLASRSAAAAGVHGAVTTRGEGIVSSFSALGNAAADLQRGLSDAPNTLLSAGRSLAGMALTGNVLGIASGMTSALLNVAGLSHGGAAGEVRALRGVVDSLRVHVDGRFAHLDAAVDSVLASLSGGFERLERAVTLSGDAARREIAAVHADVAGLGQRFDRLEANLLLYLEAGFDRAHARMLDDCLRHRERFVGAQQQMGFDQFRSCIVEFRTRGTRDARDALLTDQTTAARDDAAVTTALADTSRQSFARRVPLLARIAAERYGGGGAAQLANPLEWSIAAEAYVRMLEEWPDHAAGVTPADLDALLATGAELDAWSRRLTTDAAGRPSAALYTAILADYTRAAGELRTVVESIAQRDQQQRLQRIPREALVRAMLRLDGDGPPLDVPRGLIDRVDADALAVAMLGLQTLELRYRVALRDSTVRENFSRGFLRGTRHDRHHYAIPTMYVEAVLGDAIASTFRATGTPIHHRTDRMAGGADSERIRSTTIIVADLEARFLAEEWPRLARDADWQTLPTADIDRTRLLRATVSAELERYAAQTLDTLFRGVCIAPDAAVVPGAAAAPAAPAAAAGAPGAAAGAFAAERARIAAAMQAMTTARTLFNAFVNAGLSRTAAIHPDARTLMHGADALPDAASLCMQIQRGDGALRLLWLDDTPARAAQRATAFLEARFADAETLPEPLTIVAAAMERLQAARRLQAVRVGR